MWSSILDTLGDLAVQASAAVHCDDAQMLNSVNHLAHPHRSASRSASALRCIVRSMSSKDACSAA